MTVESNLWDALRSNKKEASKQLKEAGLSPALKQLRWSSLTKSNRKKIKLIFGINKNKENEFILNAEAEKIRESTPCNRKRDKRRHFTKTQRNEILYQQNNKCARCQKELDPRDITYHHATAWAQNGRTATVNGRAMHGSCHRLTTHEQTLNKQE